MRKHIKKTTKRAMLTSGLLGVATVGVLASGGFAYAKTGGQDSMADAIANKFKLNKTEVQQVMKEQRLQERAAHQQERLAQLVKDGKLTQAQADKLKAKEKEMQPKREAAHNETDATKREAAHEAIRAEMDQWAKDNGIDLSTIRPARGGMREGHGPGHRGMGDMVRDGNGTPAAQ